MTHFSHLVACGVAVLWAAGCGWTPEAPAPEPQVEIVGGQPSPLTLQAVLPKDLHAGMGAVAKDSPGPDRSAWPRQRLEIGRPVIPRTLPPLRNPAEYATSPDPDCYWTWKDLWPAVTSLARFAVDVVLAPVEACLTRDAPEPPLPASPQARSKE